MPDLSITPRRLMNTKEAAAYLGISVCGFRIFGFQHKLPRLGWGKHKDLYDIKDLDKIIEEHKAKKLEA
ncbi:MAG: hypothetical protein WCS96_07930 [Victivallales bacterium]